MSIIIANFGKYAISDCPFILFVVFFFVSNVVINTICTAVAWFGIFTAKSTVLPYTSSVIAIAKLKKSAFSVSLIFNELTSDDEFEVRETGYSL